jgi:hypothetical protein
MSPKILLINGPPRSGKDTLSDMFVDGGFLPFKFAAPLRKAIPAMFGITQEHYNFLIEERKEESRPELNGMSARESQIWLSEQVLKPKFGRFFFGHVAARHIKKMSKQGDRWVCSDSGFKEEAVVLMNEFGAENMALIHLERMGTSFNGDSRSYITLPNVPTMTFQNDGTKEELWHKSVDWVKSTLF